MRNTNASLPFLERDLGNLVDALDTDFRYAKAARVQIYNDGATDKISLNAFWRKQIISITGLNSSNQWVPVSSATNFQINTTDNQNYLIANQALSVSISGLNSAFRLLGSFNPVDTTVQWDPNFFTEIYVIYANEEVIDAYERVKFITSAGVNAYRDNMLSGMSIALVFYGQMVLNTDQWSLTRDVLTLDAGVVVADGLPLIVIPLDIVSAQLTTRADIRQYTLPSAGITPAYVVMGNTILAPLQYGISGNSLSIDSNVAVPANKNLIVVSTGEVTAMFTTSTGDTYTSSALNGITPDYVIYGQTLLTPAQYSITGSTITIVPGDPIQAGLQLIIQKI
jgi:hypothetical protein